MTQRALDDLIALLDLEEIEVNVFRGRSPDEPRQRMFGGQVAGQALVAAARTVERGVAHSLHAYFLRPGDVGTPILYQVDRIRDGKTFTTRRVLAIQHGKAIFGLSASFQPPEDGPDHQAPMPDAPDPESLPTWAERAQNVIDQVQNAERREWLQRERPIDTRNVDSRPLGEKRKRPPARRPDPAPMRRHLHVRHDPARHRNLAARDCVERSRLPDGEPRPRDVVPPSVPGRRVAAVRAGESVGIRGARIRNGALLHPLREARGVGGAGGIDAAGANLAVPQETQERRGEQEIA